MHGRRLTAGALASLALISSAPAQLPASAPALSPARLPAPAPVRLPPRPAASAPVPDPVALGRLLDEATADPALGGAVAASVVDAATGRSLYAAGADRPVVPASTAKLLTAVAALQALGPQHRFTTRVVAGAGTGTVVLVGDGDPTLSSGRAGGYPVLASVDRLAADAAAALARAGVHRVAVRYDASRFSGPATGPGWKPSYVTSGNVAPVAALEVDEGRATPGGRARVTDPAAAAAGAFAERLGRHGVAVRGAPAPGVAPPGASTLAAVDSPPVAALVEHLLSTSDNDLAEALARQVAVATGRPPGFAGAAAAVVDVAARAGIDTTGVRLVDGSGLSPLDRVTVTTLASVLRAAVDPARPLLRSIATGLAVAGFDGTLDDRFASAATRAAAGLVRAKTGTLRHVSALAGLTVDADGRLLIFAFVADRVVALDPAAAEAALDRIAAALAGCGCR
ncbi:MAG: D-alanyl-D-alanine carboxypeptidase/D-alanyl-D-alanine-endopeptidase [Frankiaceae bacterium]